jgi:hypothetical protein
VEGGPQDPVPGHGLSTARCRALAVVLRGLDARVLKMFEMFEFLGHISSLVGLTAYIVGIDYLTP